MALVHRPLQSRVTSYKTKMLVMPEDPQGCLSGRPVTQPDKNGSHQLEGYHHSGVFEAPFTETHYNKTLQVRPLEVILHLTNSSSILLKRSPILL